jgi:hypothetical protein
MAITIPPSLAHMSNAHIGAHLGVSATAVHQARRAAAGLCERCKSPVVEGRRLCLKHEAASDRARRKRLGNKAWRKGGPGRPPKFTTEP